MRALWLALVLALTVPAGALAQDDDQSLDPSSPVGQMILMADDDWCAYFHDSLLGEGAGREGFIEGCTQFLDPATETRIEMDLARELGYVAMPEGMLPTAEWALEAMTDEAPEPTVETPFGVGDSQWRDTVLITVVKVDWTPKKSRFGKPGKGMKNVSALIRYEPSASRGHYNANDWNALDRAGGTWHQASFGGNDPSLQFGDHRAGRQSQGWVTFEVPKKTQWLELMSRPFGEDPLYWVVTK